MIAFVAGTVIHKTATSLVVRTESIGYEIHVPEQYLQVDLKSNIELVIYQHITEKASALYGFTTWEEREWFKTLIGISGIGPKVALSILSSGTSKQIAEALHKNDMAFFNNISGIGSKTATRIIVELENVIPHVANNTQNELVEALGALGYTRKEVGPLMNDIDNSLPIERQIALILKKM